MKKLAFALSAVLVMSGFTFSSFSFAEDGGDASMADDLFGDGASPSSPPSKTSDKSSDSGSEHDLPLADEPLADEATAPIPAASSAALDHLETQKLNRSELIGFMRDGGLKSRLVK